MIRALGVQDAYIASPTFTIINRYEDGRLPVSHFDWYRLNHPEELAEIGADEELDGQRLVLVEWPEHAAPWLPPDHLRIRIEHGDDGDEREILLEAAAGLGCVVLGQWLARNDLDRELFREEP
jgi:tRNA threonylcarbamoyl adenosine modification protein YjeE